MEAGRRGQIGIGFVEEQCFKSSVWSERAAERKQGVL